MGRKALHRTKEELNEQSRIRRMRSYWKHAGKERAASLKRYYDKKKTRAV